MHLKVDYLKDYLPRVCYNSCTRVRVSFCFAVTKLSVCVGLYITLLFFKIKEANEKLFIS